MEDSTEFRNALTAALDAGGDTAEATPEPAAAPAVQPEEAAPADTAPADATGEGELLFNSAKFLEEHPELTPYAKQLQADYTRKTQQIAEERKRLEGIQESDAEWVRQFNQTYQTNPEAARRMWEETQARLFSQSAVQPETGFDEDYLTDNDRLLVEQNRALAQRLEALEYQQNLASFQSQIARQFEQLEAEFSTRIPQADRDAFVQELTRRSVPVELAADLWRGTKGYELVRQRGREEGERIASAKRQMAPSPSGLVSRDNGAPPPAATLEEHLARALADT